MSIKQRLYPTWEQEAVLRMHCDHTRLLYNTGLTQRSAWTHAKRHYTQKITQATQMRELAEARAEFDWLRAGSSSVQQAALRDLDRAFQRFFAGHARYPKHKRRNAARHSFHVRDLTVVKLNHKWAEVTIPKAGRVRFRLTRPFHQVQAATSARVSIHGGHWHISFTTPPTALVQSRRPGTGAAVGIDRGVANTIATSDGHFAHAPGLSYGQRRRFLLLQQRLSRQQKGSKRRERTKAALASLHRRLRYRRHDWVEQTTTQLARTYDLVAVEALNTKGMTRRPAPKPDPEQPGVFLPNRARAKAALNRAILASCWGVFATRLGHKTTVVAVNPRFTSQECRRCGHTSLDNRDSQAVFRCISCGHAEHADVNAAVNILTRGLQDHDPGTPGQWAHQPPGAGCSVNHPHAHAA